MIAGEAAMVVPQAPKLTSGIAKAVSLKPLAAVLETGPPVVPEAVAVGPSVVVGMYDMLLVSLRRSERTDQALPIDVVSRNIRSGFSRSKIQAESIAG